MLCVRVMTSGEGKSVHLAQLLLESARLRWFFLVADLTESEINYR